MRKSMRDSLVLYSMLLLSGMVGSSNFEPAMKESEPRKPYNPTSRILHGKAGKKARHIKSKSRK